MKEPKYHSPNPNSPTYPFSTPEGYFSRFRSEMLDRIKIEEQESIPEEVKRRLRDILKPYVYLAAMFIGMLLMFNFLKERYTDKHTNSLVALNNRSEPHSDEVIPVNNEDLDVFLLDYTSDSYLISYILKNE